MKMFRTTLAAVLVVPAFAGVAAAQTATQTVSYQVEAINQISVSGPASLVINSATAGSAPDSKTHSASTYAITTNEVGQKITAKLDSNMDSGLTLSVNLTAPAGSGASAGPVTLNDGDQDVVTGISKLNESARMITYTLDATAAAGVIGASSKTVTFTIAAGA